MIGTRVFDHVQFRRFLMVGIVNTMFGYSIFAMLVWLGVPASVALLLATILGVLFNFVTNGHFVFNGFDRGRLVRFIAAYGTVYLTNLAILDVLRAGGIATIAAQGAALTVVVPLSFLILKWFVFKSNGDATD
jgi:putative flippase GtrA